MKEWNTKAGDRIIQILSGRSNVFLLFSGDLIVLIDTGPDRLWTRLVSNLSNLDIHKIDYLILTHSHFDHAGNVFSIKKKYKPEIIIHLLEKEYITKGVNPGIKGTNFFSKAIALLGSRLETLLRYRGCEPDICVDGARELSDLGINARIIHTPGHTEGSICLIVNDEIVISGDTLFGFFKSSSFPPFALNPAELIKSWGKLLETGAEIFLPSHGKMKSREQLTSEYNQRIAGI